MSLNLIFNFFKTAHKEAAVFDLNALPEDVFLTIFKFLTFPNLVTFSLVSKKWKKITETSFLGLEEIHSVFTFLKSQYQPRSETENQRVQGIFKIESYFMTGIKYKFNNQQYLQCFNSVYPTTTIRQDKNCKVFLVNFDKCGLFIQEKSKQDIIELDADSLKADFIIQENLKLITTHTFPNTRFLLFPFNWTVIYIKPNINSFQFHCIKKIQNLIDEKFDQTENFEELNQILKNNSNL